MYARRSRAVELNATGPFGPVPSSELSGVLSQLACQFFNAVARSSISAVLNPLSGNPGLLSGAVCRKKKICWLIAVMST
jgi:hypothetical protein